MAHLVKAEVDTCSCPRNMALKTSERTPPSLSHHINSGAFLCRLNIASITSGIWGFIKALLSPAFLGYESFKIEGPVN